MNGIDKNQIAKFVINEKHVSKNRMTNLNHKIKIIDCFENLKGLNLLAFWCYKKSKKRNVKNITVHIKSIHLKKTMNGWEIHGEDIWLFIEMTGYLIEIKK